MFRRARLNVRPNVRPTVRGSGSTAQPQPQPQASGLSEAAREEAAAGAAAEPPPVAARTESNDKANSSNDAGEANKPAEMPMQRRKRICAMPNLVRPRAGPSSAQCPASKLQRRAPQAPDGSASLQKDSSPPEKSNVEGTVESSVLPEKKTPVPQVPQFSPLKKSVNKEQTVDVAAQKNDDTLQKNVPSPLKERPTQERSETQEEKLPITPTPVKEKRICSDRERILKARKLREMLKEELKKERMLKHRPPIIEGRSPPDRSKMTMRDLIYYLPENNPMKSSLAEEKRTEKNSALSQMKEQEEKNTPDSEEDNEEEEAGNGEESQDGPLLVPRVKVAEDGSIILDEESLTVEVLRTKGPCAVEENDPIFERGSTTTYSSFRKSFYTKPWSNKETEMFFLAISMVGTDFSLIGRLFPHRARAEIKNKFKREEKTNGWRIDKAFKEKRPFDFEFFAELLAKVLADEEKRKQKTVKSQKSKEKEPSRPQKKPKAKAASTEAANDQDDVQKDRIPDAETEADAVLAEKENEESLDIAEQTEEQVALEPALAKKKRKKKRRDDLEQEVENLPEEMSVSSKAAEEGKSSNKRKEMVCDESNDGHTTCREKTDSVTEGKQDESTVTEEERSESSLPVDDILERESDVNLCSFEGSNDTALETESAKLRNLEVRDDLSQETCVSELQVSKIRSEERQSEETSETQNEDKADLHRPDEKHGASESDSQLEFMKTQKPPERRCLRRPKPNLVVRRQAATQEKMEAETSSSSLVNANEKCSGEDHRRDGNEATEVENTDLDTKSEAPRKTVSAKAIVRGCRQRFKPNVTRASERKEKPEKDPGNNEMSQPEEGPKGETEKNTNQSNRSDGTSEEAAKKDDKVLETVSWSNETADLQDDSKQCVLKPLPLKRGRVQGPEPNLAAKQKDLTKEEDPEEEKTEGEEVEMGVIHHRDENSDPCLKNDVTVDEDTGPCNVMLEGNTTDSEKNSVHTSQHSQEKPFEAESCRSEKELLDDWKQVSDTSKGKSGPGKEEEKPVVSSARLPRSRFQRPKPNLRMTTCRKEVFRANNKGVSQKDTNKEESLAQSQSDSERSIPSATHQTGKYEILQPLESLEKAESLCAQEVSKEPHCKSPERISRSEGGELQFCLPGINQDDTSTPNTSKNNTKEESKQTTLEPVKLTWSRFQRYKPNLRKAVGKTELRRPENKEKKSEAEQLVLQKDEPANAVIGEKETVLCQADVLNKEEQEQQVVPQVPCGSENVLCGQSSAGKSTFQEGKLGTLKPGQFVRHGSPRTRPNLENVYSKAESPVAQKLATPAEEEMNKGENQSMAEDSGELLSSEPKGDMEVLFMGNLSKKENPDIDPESTKCETLSSSKESSNCHSKGEQEEHQPTDDMQSIQDAMGRSDELSSGEEDKLSNKKPLHQVRESHWNPRSNLMRVTRKRDYPEGDENREEDKAENKDVEECLVLEKSDLSTQNSSNVLEAASFSEATRKRNFTDSEEESCKRIRQDNRLQSPEVSSEGENQVEQEDDSLLSASQEKNSDNILRKESKRSSKQIALPKHVSEPRHAGSSASECEADCSEKGNHRQAAKLSVTRGKSLKTTCRKKSGKEHRSSEATLVTLRAFQEEEEEEEADELEPDDEDKCFAPEEVNKAPVFVPIGLRSPKPVPVQIEETMELEIPVDIPDVQVAMDIEGLSQVSVQPIQQTEEKETTTHENPVVEKGINDGSTEAAMTLLAMGDPMFQLKTSSEEWTDKLPTQDELNMVNSIVSHTYSIQNTTSSQYLLFSDTSAKEMGPSGDGSNINIKDQSAGTRIGAEEYFEKNATDNSDSSLPMVNSTRPTRDKVMQPEPDLGGLQSHEIVVQKSHNTNAPVEQLEQVESKSLRGTVEMQNVEQEQLKPAVGDSSVLHDFPTRSVELFKQTDKTERTEKEIRDAWENSEDVRPVTTSPKPEKCHLGLEVPSSVDGLPEQNPCPPEYNISTTNFTQKEACSPDSQQQCVSSTEETPAVNEDPRCPKEEQTFILTLVEIPADSKQFGAPALLEQNSEPLLPAPILISPINASETSVTEVESMGSCTTAAAAPLNSSMETTQLESVSVEPIPNLQTTQKRSAAELEDDFSPAKKAPSAIVVEDNLETTYQGYSTKSTNAPMTASGIPFQESEASAKEKGLISVLMPESMSPQAGRSQTETLEDPGKTTVENSASRQEEVMSRLTSNRKEVVSGQVMQGSVCESEHLEHTGSLPSTSKTPLLRCGRKPLGFLSLICKKSSSKSAENTKGNRRKIQKPHLVTPSRSLKRPPPSTKDGRESCSLPSTSTSSLECKNVADATVLIPSNEPSEKLPLCPKGQEKEEEPTRISEYFFSDIFMEVDDSE
ncbi:transcription factor TFIIIB component B'' homolog isoform X2 [Heliangelus exortis]|uniref:transcription factor TFIIIB component B'' homolog isoform X2 n=1 Tax=Heliangelus exortis TaxID=472823 RepID=UPI003A91237E